MRSDEDEEMDGGRRRLLCAAALATISTQLGVAKISDADPVVNVRRSKPARAASSAPFDDIRRIDAAPLNVAYIERGPVDGTPVILLHGWPYDIHSYVDVVPALVAKGFRVIVPYLRGFGATRFLSDHTLRSGQQAALARDLIAFMDVLRIERAIVGGFDWEARTACVMAALWPQRCKGLVSVSGYIIINLERNLQPLSPASELGWWYQYYFATERGRVGYSRHRVQFAKLIWKLASPNWDFDDATFHRSAAAFDNPDHAEIVVHNYRWRLSLAPGDPVYERLEAKLQASPRISVPSVTIASDFDGAAADGKGYASMFSGPYAHRILHGVGHNVPHEAPDAFAQAVLDVAAY